MPKGVPNKRHTGEFKQMVVEPMIRDKLSYPKRTYDFYILGGDNTEQLNNYMQQTEVDYADLHNQHWVNNLLPFRRLVGNAADMDLKNQPEWQHSACIYNGEAVDQDAMGNINYGFFGRHCNIPEAVLMAGAGYAQISAGTSDWGAGLPLVMPPETVIA